VPLLEVNGLSVSFRTRDGIVHAVQDLDFTIERGRTLGIVGESGSGKTVACLSLLGLLPAATARVDAGRAIFDGADLLRMPESRRRRLRGNRIAMVFQDPLSSLNPYLTIGAQLVEPLRLHGGLSRAVARARAIESMREVGIEYAHLRLDSYPHEFSGGMRQRVMIAMALSTSPDLLITDEPTTALDVTIQAQILDLLRGIRDRHGTAILFVTHNLAVVAQIADRVLVMRAGRCIECGPVEQTLRSPSAEYTRELVASIPSGPKPVPSAALPETLLRVDRVRVRFPLTKRLFGARPVDFRIAVNGVSLEVRRGEVLGLVGESGSGKSTLARAIMRLVEIDAGSVTLEQHELTAMAPAALRAIRPKLQMVFQDPYSSLDPRMTVHDCLAEALRRRGVADRLQIRSEAERLLRETGLDARMLGKYPHEFSGGQRQRIAIARALAMDPGLLVADEPVSSLDVTVQAQILELLLELNRRRTLTILFISHDLSVIRHISDRTAVMYNGNIVEIGDTETLFARPQHSYTRTLLAAVPEPVVGDR
jgi:ABC-type microcin C transport system duplicated ATPase subunit YejF